MNSIILHISDLHVSLHEKLGGAKIQPKFYLTTANDTEAALHYIDKFVKIVKKDFPTETIYLLVTGDITDAGEIKEYNYAARFILKIIEDLQVDKANVLLIPGDHDLNRRDMETFYAQNDNPSAESINSIKYANFVKFYNDVLGKAFDPNKVIVDTMLVEDSLLLLGLNSCTEINLQQFEGSIPVSKFESELKDLDTSGKKLIACTHHNLTSSYENKNDGQWRSENRKRIINKFNDFYINLVLSGNEHTSSSREIPGEIITTSDAGCLTSMGYDTAFKIYPVEIADDIILINKIYALQKISDNNFDYEWDRRNNEAAHQPNEYVIFEKEPPQLEPEIIELTNENPISITDSAELSPTHQTSHVEDNYYNPEFTDLLYDKVKNLKIFYSGHYHYSETSRAHNWIDVSKLIENKDDLNFLKNAVIDVLDKKIGEENVDMIIGLGYEGNIIATKAAIKYNKPYSFLPYSYRHDEHHESERILNFENEGAFKKVLIVTDVVNDGRTIRKLIKKRQDPFFKQVEKIYVVSLFYTGQYVLSNSILNHSFLKTIENYDIENDEEVNNIEFYTVKSLKVEKCPFGKNFREECIIYKDELSCVNLFYDEAKYRKPSLDQNM